MRCFVALWPDREAAERLAAIGGELCRRNPSARALAAADLHLTLAFIGELPDARAQQLASLIDDSFDDAPTWTIDHVGAFPRARVLWVAGAITPALGALSGKVRSCLTQFRAPFDARPFLPHVTLARSYRAAVPEQSRLDVPVPCRFGRPRLAQSLSGGKAGLYRAVERLDPAG